MTDPVFKDRAEPGHCDTCHGPIMGRSRLHLAISHAAYWTWMRLPYWLAFGKLGMAILPRAGDIAFACSCPDKNAAARSLAHAHLFEEGK